MVGLVCLTIAVICAIIARVLLVIAAANISFWWAVGVFLPFGPMLFRLNYPEAARSSFIFRVATLGFIFLFLVVGPAASIYPERKPSIAKPTETEHGYAFEIVQRLSRLTDKPETIDPQTLPARQAANEREFERLNKWSEALRAPKSDLRAGDVEGNRAYNVDLEEYKAALAKTNAEKEVLTAAAGVRAK